MSCGSRRIQYGLRSVQTACQALMAHIATGGPGGPRCSPVWFLWEDSAIWLIGSEEDSFPKRLRTEPRCAVSIVDFDVTSGILRHIDIRGHADVFRMDPARLRRLLIRYLGASSDSWNSWFKANVVDPLDLMIKITPESKHHRQGHVLLQDRT